MKALKKWILIGSAVFFIIIASVFSVFFLRSPALVVIDAPFTALYGTWRTRRQQIRASAALFRPVKPVFVADGVGADVLVFAVEEASSRPYCVLFPHRYREAALRYHEEFPEIPVALIRGRAAGAYFPDSTEEADLFEFQTDRETDLYRAGVCAGIISNAGQDALEPEENRPRQSIIVVFTDIQMPMNEREPFARGVQEQNPQQEVMFLNSISSMPEAEEISCVVIEGSGQGYLEKNLKIPVILFTWLDPALTAREVFAIFDDSPWALAVPAVKMLVKEQIEGKISSKLLFFSARIADNGVFRQLKDSADKSL
jgi:hypothetical protein